MAESVEDESTFKSLGVCEELCEACERLNWKSPTEIQKQVIPSALQGKDIIGIAETGSGKTAAFALPIIQDLLTCARYDRRIFTLILEPTRELAEQVAQQFRVLGAGIGLKCALIVGGHDIKTQMSTLNTKPHIIVATPGRMLDIMTQLKGFNLRSLKYLVMDEADRMLNADFEQDITTILRHIPAERKSYLFSATMSKKVARLNRVSLKDPVKIEIVKQHLTVDNLLQYMLFVPADFKDTFFIYLMRQLNGKSMIIFCDTRANAQRVSFLLQCLDYPAVLLHGKMSQERRSGSLNKFKTKDRTILVATDVCSRGLDIPHVDAVINLDLPKTPADYLHRVGRTARAGRAGMSYTFVTQYEWETFLAIEGHVFRHKEAADEVKKMMKFNMPKEEVFKLQDMVTQAQGIAKMKSGELDDLRKHSRKRQKMQGAKRQADDSAVRPAKKHKSK